MDHGQNLADVRAAVAAARGLSLDRLRRQKLRGRDMGEAASIVAAIPEVRQALIDLQRDFATRPGGAVLDGRDIGTVICPQAQVKIFVTATPETRATRRALELKGQGETVDYLRDPGRDTAPRCARCLTFDGAVARRRRRGRARHDRSRY